MKRPYFPCPKGWRRVRADEPLRADDYANCYENAKDYKKRGIDCENNDPIKNLHGGWIRINVLSGPKPGEKLGLDTSLVVYRRKT